MKKLALVLALLFSISIMFSSAPLFTDTEEDSSLVFVLPSALIAIESEAFEETAAELVILPNSLTTIGERAFANNRVLKSICIPESVVSIGEHAFDGIEDLVVRGTEGSYAAQWAEEHNIAFVQTETIYVLVEKLKKLLKGCFYVSLSFSICPAAVFRRRRKADVIVRSMRPQDRPELYPIDYRFP